MNRNGDTGLYYSQSLDLLIVGMRVDWHLKGRVISNNSCLDGGSWILSSFPVGYTYKNWGGDEFTYLGTYRTFITLDGYLSFIDRADYDDLKAYFKAKPHIKKLLK